jgi:heat shock protein HslJ
MLDASGNPLPSHLNATLAHVESNASTLAGTGWTLVELGGKPFVYAEQHPVTMQFDASGDRVFGSGGCNRYNGPYVQDGDRLTFGALAATRMMCENIAGEDAYFAMLAKVASFVRTGERLTLYDTSGAPLARLGYEK